MEDKTALPLSIELQLWGVVSVVGTRSIHRNEEGEFRFETLTLKVTDEAGHVWEDLTFYSHEEGSLTRIPITSTD
jgi:hypothetical protein